MFNVVKKNILAPDMKKVEDSYPIKRPKSFRKELLSKIPSFVSRRQSLPDGCIYDEVCFVNFKKISAVYNSINLFICN